MKEKKYKLGIDLSTYTCGVVLIDDDMEVYYSRVIDLSKEGWRPMIGEVSNIIQGQPLEVYVELNNFINAKLTNRWYYLYGLLNGLAPIYWKFKAFNAPEWQRFIGLKSTDTKERTKAESIRHANSNGFICYDDNLADAFNIAVYGECCFSTEERYEKTKATKKSKAKKKLDETREKIKLLKQANRAMKKKLDRLEYPRTKKMRQNARKGA